MNRIVTCGMAEDMIEKVSDHIYDNYASAGRDLSRLAVVFGGKRPSFALRKKLAGKIAKPFESPRFFSINGFAKYALSKKETFSESSRFDTLHTIYDIARRQGHAIVKNRETFERFIPWAREIASFINLLDEQDVSNEALGSVQKSATIGYEIPESINAVLGNITEIRREFHTVLKERKKYTSGMIYLFASESVGETLFDEFDEILFCGQFYLHNTEARIMKNLYERGKAVLFFKGDSKDWTVLENAVKIFNSKISPDNANAPEHDLKIYAGFDAHSQVCAAREILAGICAEKKNLNLDDTLIVLPDSDSLVPLLSEISSFVKDFNVSMGYPLRRTPLYSLFELLSECQSTKKAEQYYTRDYFAVLNHPYIRELDLSGKPGIMKRIVRNLEEIVFSSESRQLFVGVKEINKAVGKFMRSRKTVKPGCSNAEIKKGLSVIHGKIFSVWKKTANFMEFCRAVEDVLNLFLDKGKFDDYPLNLKIIEKIFGITAELKETVFCSERYSAQEMFSIFLDVLNNEIVSFSGAPLKGLQILGVLETRNLSFENAIIMDLNESKMPNLDIYKPLIPVEIMRALGLSRIETEEEIQRYHFESIISSAKKVFLIYEKSYKTERSRFIESIVWKKQKEAGVMDVIDIPVANFNVNVEPKNARIEKSAVTLTALKRMEYFSPSSIDTYLNCPLSYYYKYALKLEEDSDGEEDVDSKAVGTFLHEFLCHAFERFKGRRPVIDGPFRKDFKEMLDSEYEAKLSGLLGEESFLLKAVMDFRMEEFLDSEEKRAEEIKEIVCLESEFRTAVELDSGNYNILCKIDRIDRMNEGFLIVDYKSGNINKTPGRNLSFAEMSRRAIKRQVKSFQLPLYLYAAGQHYKEINSGENSNAMLYSLRGEGTKYLFSNKKPDQIGEERNNLSEYMRALDFILKEIMDPDMAFEADESDLSRCEYCPFTYLCR